MPGNEIWLGIIAAIATLGAAYLAYKGARHTAAASKQVAEEANDSTDQDRAVDAWRSMVQTLLGPLEKRVQTLSTELEAERKARRDASARHGRQIADQRRALEQALRELNEWRRAARTLARWGATLRDEVLRLGGVVPATPEELLTLQLIEDRDDFRLDPHGAHIGAHEPPEEEESP